MEKLGSPEPTRPSPGGGPVAGVSLAKGAGVRGDDAERAASSKLFRCACVRRWVPLAYREELYYVLQLAGPLLVFRILNFFLPFVTSIFCGHIGNAELAGFALASATINLTTTSTGFGLAVAADTLISQTFGSRNLKRVGVILQRSSLILLLFCLPCWAILINSHRLLLIMNQEDEVARIAHIFVMAFIPAVPAMFLHQLQVSYLQNQGIILPQMYTAAAANVINLAVNYILITTLEFGVLGSAIANSFSQITICLLLYGYIRWKKLYQKTWDGCSIDALQEWGSYMKLAIPSLFMVCFEWWIWEIGSFLSGLLGEVDLAAQHILMELGAITYMFPLGIQAATCVRVGNALGAGNTARALLTCKVVLVLTGGLALIQGIVIASSKAVVAYIFTSDVKIVALVSENLTIYIFLQFVDALLCVCSGILVGSGMQKIAAVSNFVFYYCISLPIGVALMFAAKMRMLGFWLSLLICVFVETGFFLVLIHKLNWKKVTEKAQQRAGKKLLATPKLAATAVLNEALQPNISDNPDPLSCEEASKTDGYSPVDTQDHQMKVGHEAEGSNANAGEPDGDAEHNKTTPKTKSEAPLSISQLILRRGLVFIISALMLLVGVGCSIAFPSPEPGAHSRANFTHNWANDSAPTVLAPLNLTTNF